MVLSYRVDCRHGAEGMIPPGRFSSGLLRRGALRWIHIRRTALSPIDGRRSSPPCFGQCDRILLPWWWSSAICSVSFAMLRNRFDTTSLLLDRAPCFPLICKREIHAVAVAPTGIVNAGLRAAGVELCVAKSWQENMQERNDRKEGGDMHRRKAPWSEGGGRAGETSSGNLREEPHSGPHHADRQNVAGAFATRWRNDWRMGRRGGPPEYRRGGRNWRAGRRVGFGQHRSWFSVEDEIAVPHEKIVLVSYNILADKNAAEHYRNLYFHIPWEYLRWERRKRKMVAELTTLSPDIMCLQEVDKFEDLRQEFERIGYRGAYAARTGGALDGCAMFWKSSRFLLLEEQIIEFNDFALKDNVAQLCVFQTVGEGEHGVGSEDQQSELGNLNKKPAARVVVGNIHVLFNPKRGDVKLGQVRVLLESAETLSKEWGDAPIAIGGDFNSTPKSDLYKFLATSELDLSDLNRTTMSGQVEGNIGGSVNSSPQGDWNSSGDRGPGVEEKLSMKTWRWSEQELLAATGRVDCSTVQHNLHLRSAYPQIQGAFGSRDENGEPLVTTFHRKFMGTVDYIWHTEGLQALKVLDTVPVNALKRWQGLPTQEWGSDHLAIACELAILTGVQAD